MTNDKPYFLWKKQQTTTTTKNENKTKQQFQNVIYYDFSWGFKG